MKLVRKFALALFLGVCGLLAINAYIRIRIEVAQFERDAADEAKVMGQALGTAIEIAWRDQGKESALALVDRANHTSQLVKIRWVFHESRAGDPHSPKVDAALLDRLGLGQDVIQQTIEQDNRAELVTYVPITVAGKSEGALEFSKSLVGRHAYVQKTLFDTLLGASIVALVCGFMATGLGMFLVGRPMRALVRQARRIGQGDLSKRLAVAQRDEIGELALEMNAMCDQLAEAKQTVAAETAARIAAIEQLRHADRLATVGKLASGIAHELGAPLLVVQGRARMIVDGDLSAAEIPENASIILAQAKRITAIVRQLLDFARRRGPTKVKTDLTELAARTCKLLSPFAAKKRVAIERLGDGTVAADVDGEQIQQALTNLIVNAVDAMPDGGGLTVGIGVEHAKPPVDHGGPEGDYSTLWVEDKGGGMSPETMSHVFEPFFTTKEVGEGTGLGLSVSYGIARDHGGWIGVRSEPGVGSRFSIFLPMETAA